MWVTYMMGGAYVSQGDGVTYGKKWRQTGSRSNYENKNKI
jgi:hypothetical protein